MVKLVPGGERDLSHLSDAELLTSTRRLVGTSNKLFAALLLHLAEVEARGIHRQRACASLYTYCIYELRMSEDAAARRSSAARLVKAFPALLEAIAAGELHLTGLLMLGPHLTRENHVEVLARARFRTKKELAKLVRELHPLPLVPDEMEALGSEPLPAGEPTWGEWVTSLGAPVRELPSNERPGQWANDTVPGCSDGYASAFGDEGAPGPAGPGATEPDEDDSTALRRRELPPITAPQQYRMQFSTTEEHVRLVERAKALLARMPPGRSLGELHQQAMELLVDKLEKAKFAVTEPRPRARGSGTLAVALDADASQRAQRKPASMASGQTAEEREIEPGEPLQRKRAPRRRGRHDIWLHPRTHPRII